VFSADRIRRGRQPEPTGPERRSRGAAWAQLLELALERLRRRLLGSEATPGTRLEPRPPTRSWYAHRVPSFPCPARGNTCPGCAIVAPPQLDTEEGMPRRVTVGRPFRGATRRSKNLPATEGTMKAGAGANGRVRRPGALRSSGRSRARVRARSSP
jgi:hypothetical protein